MGRGVTLIAALACLGMMGCGAPAPIGNGDTGYTTAGADLTDADVFSLVRLLAGSGAPSGVTVDPARLLRANQRLTSDQPLRESAYVKADPIVRRVFGMPGQPDSLTRLTGGDMQALMRALQPGDIIQCGNDGSFIHGVFYRGENVIVHALAEPLDGKPMAGVHKETLTGYFERVERDAVVVLRPRWTPPQLKSAVAYADAQVGKGYDTLFLTQSPDRFYCTELVYRILTAAKVARIRPRLVQGAWPVVMNEDLRQSPDLTVVYTQNHP